MDTIQFTQKLIQCQSITPQEGGSLAIIENFLSELGFECVRLDKEGVSNLYARKGKAKPHLCFAGHVDVVPIQEGWTCDPFEGVIKNNFLYGRGVSDMKGAIAAMLCAVRDSEYIQGSISFLLTSDEEGPGQYGTRHVVEWLKEKGETIDHALIGEPTNPAKMGTMVKVGRRGSFNFEVHAQGKSGHVAYPKWHDNPLNRLIPLLNTLQQHRWDEGTELFDPAQLQVVSLTCPHQASNLINEKAWAWVNVRMNTLWPIKKIQQYLESLTQDPQISWVFHNGFDAFMGADETWFNIMKSVLPQAVMSTSGGISDARFLKDLCPVAEYGLISSAAHQVDECVSIDDLKALYLSYKDILKAYFAEGRPCYEKA